MVFKEHLDKIKNRYKVLSDYLSVGFTQEHYIDYSKEYAELTPIVQKINEYYKIISDLESAYDLSQEGDIDQGTKLLAIEEINQLKKKHLIVEKEIKILLLPKDHDDNKSAIIEVRAGTGGGEAALFAADLFLMYQRYAELKGWKFEILSITEIGVGGYKEASALIKGDSVFARLKYEAGVHRVQRVPLTESSGRIHTSAATVAVLPEAEEVDVNIIDSDLRIDTYRSSGAGGQHVNTTDSAIRITHLPTGIVVCQQDEKSQHKNKAKALKILRSRVYELERQKNIIERTSSRKAQIGSGDRSERIRTYNFPQGRISDHRINLTMYKIIPVLKEGKLDDFINALISDANSRRLVEED